MKIAPFKGAPLNLLTPLPGSQFLQTQVKRLGRWRFLDFCLRCVVEHSMGLLLRAMYVVIIFI